MKNFIAMDFETANYQRHSICSVGFVFVEDGEIVDSIYQLINPEEEFDNYNIDIHGITPNDVSHSPTFKEFYESNKHRLENKLLIAHYLPFDGYALRDNLYRYELEPVNNQLLCTYQLSKKLLQGQSSYTLSSLCHHLGIELQNHHHALDDAKACARIMLHLVNEFDLLDYPTIFDKTRIKPGKLSKEQYQSSLVHKTSKGGLDLTQIEVSQDVDKDHAFFGKHIVFTGKLNLYTRKEAALEVAKRGGMPQNGINKDTNFIVLGDFEDVMIKGNKSSKLLKAEKMITEGKDLEIISEHDFLMMLS
jgi:DNA polymerase III subunit epsilon